MGAVALAAVSAIIWGVGDYAGGRASRAMPALRVTALVQLLGLPVALAAALAMTFWGTGATVVRPADLAWGAAAGLAGLAGIVLLYRALAGGAMAVAAPTTAVAAAVLPVGIGLLLGERPGPTALIGVVCALLSVALVSAAGGSGKVTAGLVLTAIGAGTGFGLFFAGMDRFGENAGMWPLVGARVIGAVLGLAVLLLTRRPEGPLPRRELAAAGSLDTIANVTYLLALHSGMLAVVAPVASLYPASTVLLAFALDRERVRPVQVTGLALAGAALVLTSIA
ncbi:membrane protein [Actinorhabdospora filicis]|uniref:Membrane protein n=1 Tax=Actinorhabdospora filicis TaxID=1785913 RepID=A0A9W6SNC1_9ACTN|nr:EamA family transporter [Actinorhabdospora filicis]GLZ79047.1 membrane protein [Actinorhabdospora filicis]